VSVAIDSLSQGGNCFIVRGGISGQVGHGSQRTSISMKLVLRIMFYYIFSVVSSTAGSACDDALLPFRSCKFASEISPSLAYRSTTLPISAGIRDGISVGDQDNVDILCVHVRLHPGVGITDSNLNMLE
jgi:hypothetical protein